MAFSLFEIEKKEYLKYIIKNKEKYNKRHTKY